MRSAFFTARCAVAACSVMVSCVSAFGSINLEWRANPQVVNVGSTVNLGLYAVSDSASNQLFTAAQVVLSWDPTYLGLLGNDDTGALPWVLSEFPAGDPYGLNEVSPPQDGNGIYLALSLGTPNAATPTGALITTMQFRAIALTNSTVVSILPSGGSPIVNTAVFDSVVPNLNVLGTFNPPGKIMIVPEPATAILLTLGLVAAVRRR